MDHLTVILDSYVCVYLEYQMAHAAAAAACVLIDRMTATWCKGQSSAVLYVFKVYPRAALHLHLFI